MRTDTFDLSAARHPTIRADQPTVIELSPAVIDSLAVAAGAVVMALAGAGLALYLMLPFGA